MRNSFILSGIAAGVTAALLAMPACWTTDSPSDETELELRGPGHHPCGSGDYGSGGRCNPGPGSGSGDGSACGSGDYGSGGRCNPGPGSGDGSGSGDGDGSGFPVDAGSFPPPPGPDAGGFPPPPGPDAGGFPLDAGSFPPPPGPDAGSFPPPPGPDAGPPGHPCHGRHCGH